MNNNENLMIEALGYAKGNLYDINCKLEEIYENRRESSVF